MSTQLDFSDEPVVLQYRRRADDSEAFATPPYEAKMSTPTWTPGVELSNDVISRRDVLRCLGQRDDEEARRLAINAVNDLSQRYGDVLTGNPSVELSDEGLFPAYDVQSLPTAVQITYAREQIVDTQWTALFQVQDRRDQSNRQFTIEDVYSAASFQQYADGEEIEIQNVYGDSQTYEFNIYAGGLQWSRFWEDWQDMWRESDGTAMMQARYGQKQASRAYSVLTAGSPGTTSYQNFDGSGSTSLTNDVATFNKAAETILNDMYTNTTLQGGTDVGEQVEEEFQNPNFFILVSQFDSSLMTRTGRALQASYDAPNDNQSTLETAYPMQMIATPHVSTGTWYMVFPGRKNVAAIARDMTMYEKTDVQTAGVADANIAQGSYRMIRGDDNQVQEMNTS